MKEWSGAEVTGSSDGRREVPGSGAPSAGASEVMIVVRRHAHSAERILSPAFTSLREFCHPPSLRPFHPPARKQQRICNLPPTDSPNGGAWQSLL